MTKKRHIDLDLPSLEEIQKVEKHSMRWLFDPEYALQERMEQLRKLEKQVKLRDEKNEE